MGEAKRLELQRRADAFLQAAEESHLTWNGTTWTQAHHLFGFLCLEPRRACFATALLKHMGETVAAAPPVDTIDKLMLERLQVHSADGSLDALVQRLELKTPAVLTELKRLATTPAGETAVNPVLSLERTPCMYSKFIPLLFVGFAHNLRIESLVSVLGKLERAHPNANSQVLDYMFTYRTGNEGERTRRRDASMRSTRGGGARAAAREQAEEGKGLREHSRSKKQLKLLERQAEARAARYEEVARRRGVQSVRQKRKRLRDDFDAARKELDNAKFQQLQKTCAVTANGNKRRVALSARECSLLVPTLHAAAAKVKSFRGSGFKQAKLVAAGKARLKADKQELRTTQKRLSRKRPRNQRELRLALDERPEQGGQATRTQPARKRAATVVEEESSSEEEEYEGEEEEDECDLQAGAEAAAARRVRAEEVRVLREEGAQLRGELNKLRYNPVTQVHDKFPQEAAAKAKYKELMPRYKEIKERLACLDA